eukprot:TRINITY_DN282_c0_g1_i6.p1 TRINITY_DN282_c0_g1~~TRINITY_DN282_c0_g1_i6.p1  ORF type:complete len:336 (-),score=54.31 TRINITY_DN282_c0_g1_i6:74-1081(-)
MRPSRSRHPSSNKPLSGSESRKVLEKAIPRSGKFEGMKPVIDTGNSLSRAKERAEKAQKFSTKKRQGELFTRISPNQLSDLLLSSDVPIKEFTIAGGSTDSFGVEEVEDMTQSPASPRQSPPATPKKGLYGSSQVDIYNPTNTPWEAISTPRKGRGTPATHQGMQSSLNVFHLDRNPDSPLEKSYATPRDMSGTINSQGQEHNFLLLDLRTSEQFETGHLNHAVHYPSTNINKASNYFTSAIVHFRNKPNKKIILYDNSSSREAARVANAFVQKGVDNVYLVVGGLRAVADIYPECLQGDVPPPSPTGSVITMARSEDTRLNSSHIPLSRMPSSA